jgi:hypothetical protein
VRYAIMVGLRTDDPTLGLRPPRRRSEGIYAWTEEDIARFETKYPIGTRARLAMALLLYTAQRRADVMSETASSMSASKRPASRWQSACIGNYSACSTPRGASISLS